MDPDYDTPTVTDDSENPLFPEEEYYYSGLKPRTQKLRGLIALRNDPAKWLFRKSSPDFYAIQTDRCLNNFINRWAAALATPPFFTPVFARPCPVRPRHGFVDSIPIHSTEALRTIWRKARKADSEAEMILMAPVEAVGSAIYTPDSLSIGPGHDGATAGKGSHFIAHPAPSSTQAKAYLASLKEESSIDTEHSPYVELVFPLEYEGQRTHHVVQVRSGPHVSPSPDYIPCPVDITEIVEPRGEDLIDWEVRASTFTKGTVVYHAGGGPASHYSIHCVHNQIPYITTYKPEVGEHIFPRTLLPPPNLQGLRDGIFAGVNLDINFEEASYLMLYGLHSSALNHHYDGWRMIGLAATQCLRLGSAACLGEYRHHQKKQHHLIRQSIFKDAWSDFFGGYKRMTKVWRSFANTHWKNGYGGTNWATCAEQNLILFMDILDFVKKPSEVGARQIASDFNRAVNVAHNGGWLFNKFISGKAMDDAASASPYVAVKAAIPLLKGLDAPVDDPGWRKVRKSRVLNLKVRQKENGKEIRYLEDTPGNYTNHGNNEGSKRCSHQQKVWGIQGSLRDKCSTIHLQYKLKGRSSYATLTLNIAPEKGQALASRCQGKASSYYGPTHAIYHSLEYDADTFELKDLTGTVVYTFPVHPKGW